jgi:Lon protease-like protein
VPAERLQPAPRRVREMGEPLDSLPLFPLGIVLLPSEMVQLHIFEERYKLMIGECLESGREFGILWLSDERLHDVGCTARVTEVLERYDDGRMDILVAGGRPMRLVRRIDELAYPAGDVELLDLNPAPADAALAAEARERYADLVERVTDERPPAESLEGLDAFAMAGTIEFKPAEKQKLLEQPSEDERLRAVADLFTATLKRLDESERSAELAKSNGHMRR